MLKAFKLIGFGPPKRWDYSLWRNSIPEVQIYTRVDHGSMGHGSRIRWVRWVMGHEK